MKIGKDYLKGKNVVNLVLIVAALFMLAALLFSEKQSSVRLVLVTKSSLSMLFILTALLQQHPVSGYFHLLLAGLIFCMMGDICLALPQAKAFMLGLIAFLLGHVFYLFGFISLTDFYEWISVEPLVILTASAVVFAWLRPHLRSMFFPVLAYIVVITVMLWGAWAVFKARSYGFPGPMFIFAGAFFFYVSDFFVARNRFVRRGYVNRLFGLPLYYLGQFLLAFSVGLV
ncbi:MAG: lysoplasmalogenase [Deltaproteobacteria bacterium]|nr:lysoplasmalogenase [Deltaproteobacteria bacterium]